MRRLFIAEKASLAQDIANHLGVSKRCRGYFECGDDIVTNAKGHLFELAAPEFYSPRYHEWTFDNMPIVPSKWALLPKQKEIGLVQLIGQLLKAAPLVVHAGDADNEGQLLIDEILEHFGYRGPVRRFWASATNPASLQAALANLRDNREYTGMREAARARSRMDWLIGKNCSRAFTMKAQAEGFSGALRVGRVTSPTLAMIVKRDEEIANFRPVPYHFVTVTATHQQGAFRMRWQPPADQPGLDEEGRLVDTAIANAAVERLTTAAARVTEYTTTHKRESQPRSLSLAGVGLLSSKMFGYSAAQTLQICQSLYETHKITSYPRTDSEYLKESMHDDAPRVLAAVRDNLPGVAPWVDYCDTSIKSKTWDDNKAPVHHGIIPTEMRCDINQLSEAELNVYQLIVRAYIAQFFPLYEYDEITVLADASGDLLAAKGKVVTEPGWKALYEVTQEEGEDTQSLPAMVTADPLQLTDATRHDKKTSPPKRFDEGTLPIAMENIYHYVDDPEDRKALQDGDGIGTSATRAPTIEDLKKRGLIVSGKWIESTPLGRQVLQWIAPELRSPALTAHFERNLRAIEQGRLDPASFIEDQTHFVASLVDRARAEVPQVERLPCPECDAGHLRRVARRDRSGHFWSCSAWRDGCKFTANDQNGQPDLEGAAARRASRRT